MVYYTKIIDNRKLKPNFIIYFILLCRFSFDNEYRYSTTSDHSSLKNNTGLVVLGIAIAMVILILAGSLSIPTVESKSSSSSHGPGLDIIAVRKRGQRL